MSPTAGISAHLPPDRLSQVDFGTTRQVLTLREKGGELLGHLRPYFEAASANPRANRDDKIFWTAAKSLTHRGDRLRNDLERRATPTGMYRGNCSIRSIGDQYGEAIGCPDREGDSGLIRDQGIAIADDAPLIGIQDRVRMHLPKCRCLDIARPT